MLKTIGCTDPRLRIFVRCACILGVAGAHERYRALRSSFYVDVGGVIIVTDGADPKRYTHTTPLPAFN